MNIQDVEVTMEVDTGSASTIMSKEEYTEKFQYLKLYKLSHINLYTISGNHLTVLGALIAPVLIANKNFNLKIIVIATGNRFRLY